MVFEETSIGLNGMAMVFNGSQPLVKRSIIGNEPLAMSNPKLGHGIFPVPFSTAKRMVGQDILCKFLVNNVIACHLWTITSPLIAQGGLGIGEYRAPDFCRRRCTYNQIPMLKFACHSSFFLIAHLSISRNEHIEKPFFAGGKCLQNLF